MFVSDNNSCILTIFEDVAWFYAQSFSKTADDPQLISLLLVSFTHSVIISRYPRYLISVSLTHNIKNDDVTKFYVHHPLYDIVSNVRMN